jgi:Uma2 family endonuclease
LAETGILGPQEKLELIEGDIVEKMTQNAPHSTGICRTEEALRQTFSEGYVVRVQMPLAAAPTSQPDPDLAVVPGSLEDYEEAHPTTAVLVVEVSDSTLAYDRTVKARLYAGAGVAEYWSLNLNERRLEVHREPTQSEVTAAHYHTVTLHPEDDTVSPLTAPDARIVVRRLLPRSLR